MPNQEKKKKKSVPVESNNTKTRETTRPSHAGSRSASKKPGASKRARTYAKKGTTGKKAHQKSAQIIPSDEEEPSDDDPLTRSQPEDDADESGNLSPKGKHRKDTPAARESDEDDRRSPEVDESNGEVERLEQANETLILMLRKRVAEVDDYKTQLAKTQAETLVMKNQVRSLKRASTEPPEDDEEPPTKKQKAIKHKDTSVSTRAAAAGKRYTALYDAWGSREAIFDGFRAAALKAGAIQEESDESSSDEDESSSSSSEDEGSGDKGVKKGANKAAGRGADGDEESDGLCDFSDPAGQEAYTKASAMRFWQDAKAKEVKGWQSDRYQSRFMYAASRMRSAFREHTEDPRVVFGFSIEAKDFGRKTRKEHPEVAEIINDNTTFLPEITDGPELAYRHPCLLQIARKVLYGKAALLTGKKSPMAREVFSAQWRIKGVTVHFIAIVAYMAFFILSGEDTLTLAPNTVEIYWDHLDSLIRLQKGGSDFIDDLFNYWNAELGIKDSTKPKRVNVGKAALLQAFGA